jgi:serine/threonine protein kinase
MVGLKRVGDWIADRFEIFDVHEGGMSLVYVVHDHLGRSGRSVVALKTLKDELISHRIRRSRFATECRLWVQLGQHPNIVQAHAVEILEGKPFVVMELVQGGDLVRWIGTPRLDLPQTLRFAIQFCQGMEHAARQGLSCHRDVKPGNLLITEDGILKITDFGLARICEEMVAVRPELPDGSIPLADVPRTPQRIIFTDPRDQQVRPLTFTSLDTRPAHQTGRNAAAAILVTSAGGRPALTPTPPVGPGSTVPTSKPGLDGASRRTPTTAEKSTSEYVSPLETANPRLTRSGARLGTGAYMSPEQFRDPGAVDIRADIYGFGVVLFEMLTGRLPFTGKSLDLLDRQHSRYEPPSIVPLIPRAYARRASDLDRIVQRCLKKNPGERYPAMSALRKDLQRQLARITAK